MTALLTLRACLNNRPEWYRGWFGVPASGGFGSRRLKPELQTEMLEQAAGRAEPGE